LDSQLKILGKKNTIAALDGVRAIACLSVVEYHLNRFAFISHVLPFGFSTMATAYVLSGSAGVTLFFVLSGFLLFMPYVRSLLFDTAWPSARRFYTRRAFRILPGYYISLALLILLTHREYLQPAHWQELGLFLTLLMDSSHSTYQAINGPFWTLAVEWQFYMLLPLLAWGFRWVVQRGSLQRRLNVVFLCLGGLIIWGVATRYWGRSWDLHPNQPALLPPLIHNVALFFFYGFAGKYLEDFAVGMLICVCYGLAQSIDEHRITLTLRRYCWWLWGIGILWLFYIAIWSTLPGRRFVEPLIGAHNWLSEIALAAGYGLCVTAILFGPVQLKSLLEWKPLRWIGLLSYSMYIWHLPILLWFMANILPYTQTFFAYDAYWLCVALVIVPFSYVFYRLVELPWIRVGSRVTRTKEV
jgi:peptidoglycan/LPS O-acetylase OafA/YrhL